MMEWHIRRAAEPDCGALHELSCVPDVYRYLSDGVAPPRWRTDEWVMLNRSGGAANGQGLWLLVDASQGLAGCVSLKSEYRARSAELTYLLAPEHWGQGLATRMSWTVIDRAFRASQLSRIVAGADEPNVASVAVMRRLGMTFQRRVSYPLGPGVEYALQRDDPKPTPIPDSLPVLE